MIPFNNLPANTKVDWFLQPTLTGEVHEWTKPVGCNFVYMIAAGGGGWGGNGASGAAGTARGGGGSGGGGCLATLLVPAFLITDSLFIRVGPGGNNAAGTLPFNTIISAYRINSSTEYYLNAPSGSNGGSGTASTPGGAAGTSTNSYSTNALGTIGKWQSPSTTIAGLIGGAIAGAAGTSYTFTNHLSPGASGAGTTSGDFAGGDILSAYGQQSTITVVPGGAAVAGATAGQNNGSSGFWIPKRFAFYGGAGGGASNTGVGGNGGNGALGCGGGGGGAGITGGTGGNGGDGFVVIISY
jgi:hypothetical protein